MKHIKIIKEFSLNKFLEWQALLFIVAIVLVPKFPLLSTDSPVPIRYDDLFIIPPLLTTLFIIYKNKSWRGFLSAHLTKVIFLWLVVMLLATVLGILRGTLESPVVSFLFWLRYIQYFSIFFVGIAVLRSSQDLPKFFLTLVGLIIPIGIYAIGQRLGIWGGYGGAFYNYQFLAGVDRAFATFAGPYELAAYLVLTIPIVVAISFGLKNIWQKFVWASIFIISTLALSYTAARTPLASVFVGVSFLTIFITGWKRRVWAIFLAVFLVVVPFFLSDTLASRAGELMATLQSFGRSIVYNTSQPSNGPFVSTTSSQPNSMGQTPTKTQPEDGIFNFIQGLVGEEDGSILGDLPQNSPQVAVEPSLKWRVDNLWPQAIDQFRHNIFMGGGLYSSGISVDSTYLTLLGETGLIGIVFFFWVIWEIFRLLFSNIRKADGLNKLLLIGFLGGIVALLVNALFIDVFRASKIAYIFWFLIGISVKYLEMRQGTNE